MNCPCCCNADGFEAVITTGFLPVQTGEVDISGTSVTDTLAAVDLSKSVLEFSYSYDDNSNDPHSTFVRGQITSATVITFNRFTASGTVTIRWFVWEALPTTPMTVQRGSVQVGNSASQPVDVAITSVSLDKSFVITSSASDEASSPSEDSMVRAKITTSINCEFELDSAQGNSAITEYQIVENSNWDVTVYDPTMAGTSVNQTLSPTVPLANAYMFLSGTFDTDLDGNQTPIYKQTSISNVSITRTDSGGSWNFTLYVVDTKGDMVGQHINGTIGDGNTVQTNSITAIDLARTFIKMNSVLNSMQLFVDGDNAADHVFVKGDFVNSTTSRSTRGAASGSVTDYSLQVHEFP